MTSITKWIYNTLIGDSATLENENRILNTMLNKQRQFNRELTELVQTYKDELEHTKMMAIKSSQQVNSLPNLPISLRKDLMINIEGLPTDFSIEEAKYISGILNAYAQPIPQPTLEEALDSIFIKGLNS